MTLLRHLRIVQPQPPQTAVFDLATWLPDLPEFANPGSTIAKNVIPHSQSYLPLPSLTTASQDALAATVLGAISAQDANGSLFVYAGDTSALYEMVDGSFSDESQAGGYLTGSDDVWEFAVFNDNVLATNYADAIQTLAVGNGGGGNFANSITSTLKPKARHMDVVREFVVLGGTNDATDGEKPNRVWWSAVSDETDFDPDPTTQCDYEDLQGGGWVQRVVGGDYGLIFMEKKIVRMSYVGSPQVFRFDDMDRRRGTPIPNSVIPFGRMTFYISDEGFHVFDGTQSHPIGAGAVDRWFWGQFDITNKRRMSGAIDSKNKLVVWAFPGDGSADGTPNKLLMYRWDEQKWAEAEIDTHLLLRTETQGYTLDGLDAAFGSDIDDTSVYSVSLDSDFYKGGGLKFAAFNTSNELAFFDGSALEATIETRSIQLAPDRWSLITEVYPITDANNVRVQVGCRDRLADMVDWGQVNIINSDGFASTRCSGQTHRIRLTIPAGEVWSHIQGARAKFTPAGRR